MGHPRTATATAAAIATIVAAATLQLAPATGAAPRRCQPATHNPLVPRLLTPCDGATIKKGSNPTFTVADSNVKAKTYRPYLNLQTSDAKVDGHLTENTNGRGLFFSLNPVAGHPGRWSFTPRRYPFATYWENRPGTYYVQIQQVDARAGTGDVFYSKIITLHVR